VECECDRWLEIWNLVFMQYDRDASGRLTPLPAPCIDTGMGLERITAVVQGKLSNYDTDLFRPLIAAVAARARTSYGASPEGDVSLRVVADHLRAMTFLIADGVMPGNEGRGYVLRKIMRRAMRHGKKLGIEGPFLHELVHAVVSRMGGAYPELLTHAETVSRIVRAEEERFGTTLRTGIQTLERSVMLLVNGPNFKQGQPFPGEEAFRLYDTFGLPLDLIEEEVADRGLTVDREGFERELEKQRDRARQSSKMGAVTGDPVYMGLLEKGKTDFLGYESLVLEDARVLAVLKDGQPARRLDAGEEGGVVLDRTPFYGKSGGQVGDRGWLSSGGSTAEVTDTLIPVPGLYVHHVKVTAGGFEAGMSVRVQVDEGLRSGAMRHHTATHLLHAALREQLGPHVKQAGSEVAPHRLRFDFSHFQGLSPREQRHIENRVNDVILKDAALQTKVMGREDALAYGALAFFGDKYGDRVRVVEVPGFSKEFCGGTHVAHTGQIGLFLFTHEGGISAGTRRVEAITGEAALQRAQEDQGILEELEETAKTDRRGLVDEYAKLRDQLKTLQRENERLKHKLAAGGGAAASSDLQEIAGVQVWTPQFDLDRKAHATVVDEFRNRNRDRPFVVLSSSIEDGGVHVISAVSDSLKGKISAPELMKRLGLRGGGRPDFAQGGGVAPSEIAALRSKAVEVAREVLKPT
jgi:alanyl-tRNA synthetase